MAGGRRRDEVTFRDFVGLAAAPATPLRQAGRRRKGPGLSQRLRLAQMLDLANGFVGQRPQEIYHRC